MNDGVLQAGVLEQKGIHSARRKFTKSVRSRLYLVCVDDDIGIRGKFRLRVEDNRVTTEGIFVAQLFTFMDHHACIAPACKQRLLVFLICLLTMIKGSSSTHNLAARIKAFFCIEEAEKIRIRATLPWKFATA